jgi:prepilin-type N-terminal cleavage/methylation domain-containing protein
MKHQQSGFTLVEIAIVLVIVGLLLGGVLKGQELINSAKVKNLAQDFKSVELYIYGYQDRFKAIPGDDQRADTNLPGGVLTDRGNSNGVIDGTWNSVDPTAESAKFWRAVRLTNFAAGPTDVTDLNYYPQNVEGQRIGITSGAAANTPVSGMTGTYVFCSQGLLGKFAKQLDTTLDDGNTATGSLRTIPNPTSAALTQPTALPLTGPTAVDDNLSYTVCKAF